jgi:heme/copper-type cytochrome/quinol oxidase subunit 1
MTTIDTSPDAVAEPSGESAIERSLAAIADTLTSADHKVIGRLFVAGGALGLLATLVVTVLLGLERTDGDGFLLDEGSIAQLIDAQRIGLVFAAAFPLVLGLAIAAVPLQLGARSLAFPRLAATGLWMWLGGLVLNIVALANNGGSLGGDADMVDLYLASIAVMALGVTAAAGSLATSVLTTRAPGMTLKRAPLFSQAVLVYAGAVLLVMPVLFGTMIYLFIDHRYSREAFGGNVGVLEWAGWVMTQPTTFLLAIPVFGLLIDQAAMVFGKRAPMRGVALAGFALIGVSALAGVTQRGVFEVDFDQDQAGDVAQELVPYAFFNLLPLLGAVIVLGVMALAAKPEKGSTPKVTGGFILTLFGGLLVLLGMVANALYDIVDLELIGTVFEEGTILAVVLGTVIGVFGGLTYWAPKFSGGTIGIAKAAPVALLAAGAALAAVALMVAGFLDQPGLYAGGITYDDSDLAVWNILSVIGVVVFALAVLAFLGLVVSARRSDDADDEPPAGVQTVEWLTASPAPTDNFETVPVVRSPEPVLDLQPATTGSDA